jgi:hypothetical protein
MADKLRPGERGCDSNKFPKAFTESRSINGKNPMIHPRARRRRASILLATAALWLIAVTLCSTNALAEVLHEHEPVGHGSQAPAGDHHEGNCCKSVQTFAAPMFASHLVKAPISAAVSPIFLFACLDTFSFDATVTFPSIRSTSPPERISFAELVLQRCRQSQAPPLLS